MVVVLEYNQIIDFMDDNERNLFAEHLQTTNKVIQPGITRFKWSSKANVDSFLGRTCRGICSDLYNKLKEFKANTDKIEQKCQEIASKLFLKINKKHSYQIGEFYDEQKEHREDIKQKLQTILKEITDILCRSYELFTNGRKDTQLFWFNYVKDIDRKIEDALKKGIKNSLIEFYVVIGDADKNITPTPIFEISAILEREDTPKLAYKPTTSSLLETITEIISSINDVVSGFGKVQNKMQEVYKKKREEMLVRMEKEKNPTRKAIEE
jgi:dynein heavy chain, axonemal